MENELENKQTYLRTEILDKGYNAQEFFDFLVEKKGEEGGDLNNWLMIDLKAIVLEFQQSHQTNINQNNTSNDKSEQEFSNLKINETDNQQTPETTQEINNPNDNNKEKQRIEKKSNIYEIICKKDDNGKLSKYDALIIKLSFPEKKVESSGLLHIASLFTSLQAESLLHIVCSFEKKIIDIIKIVLKIIFIFLFIYIFFIVVL